MFRNKVTNLLHGWSRRRLNCEEGQVRHMQMNGLVWVFAPSSGERCYRCFCLNEDNRRRKCFFIHQRYECKLLLSISFRENNQESGYDVWEIRRQTVPLNMLNVDSMTLFSVCSCVRACWRWSVAESQAGGWGCMWFWCPLRTTRWDGSSAGSRQRGRREEKGGWREAGCVW